MQVLQQDVSEVVGASLATVSAIETSAQGLMRHMLDSIANEVILHGKVLIAVFFSAVI